MRIPAAKKLFQAKQQAKKKTKKYFAIDAFRGLPLVSFCY